MTGRGPAGSAARMPDGSGGTEPARLFPGPTNAPTASGVGQRRWARPFAGLVGWLALVFAVAALGARASVTAAPFYAQLIRPSWAPPAGAFGPVWTLLYLLMGVAAWRVWRRRDASRRRRAALGLFLAQLAANALWSWLFFAWRLGAAAFADVLLLLVLIAATMLAFGRIDRLATVLMAPYLAWVALASALTASVWRANPAWLG